MLTSARTTRWDTGPASGQQPGVASYLARWHGRTTHHISASQCETVTLADLLALADQEDADRWHRLRLGYTDPIGAPWLRDAIASGFATLQADDIICFSGAQEAIFATLHALLGPDDHAIVVLPTYPAVETLLVGLCDVTGVALAVDRAWDLDIDLIVRAIRPNTRVLAIGFPNNPTGYMPDRDRMAELLRICRRHGISVVSDEVYRLIERDQADRLDPVCDLDEHGVTIGAVSKAYGLPGLRLGWVASRDRALIGRLATLKQYLSTCSTGPSEVLASIALKASSAILGRNHALARANLVSLADFLDRHDEIFDWTIPKGGVVGYVRYLGPDDVEAWVRRMAEEAGVLLLPSSVFRSSLHPLPDDHFRIGFGQGCFIAGLQALEERVGVSRQARPGRPAAATSLGGD